MANEDTDTRAGILKAIKWLRATGRSIVAAKMERELLPADQHKLENSAFLLWNLCIVHAHEHPTANAQDWFGVLAGRSSCSLLCLLVGFCSDQRKASTACTPEPTTGERACSQAAIDIQLSLKSHGSSRIFCDGLAGRPGRCVPLPADRHQF
jgi:hypothetical protein